MQVEVNLPKFIITWGQDQNGVQIPIVVPMYFQIKRMSNNTVVVKQFDTNGGYHGANNHPNEFKFLLEEGDYEITLQVLHQNRMLVQAFLKRHDDPDTNSSGTSIAYAELKAGQEMKFTANIQAYNPGETQWYKFNALAWFENKITHQFSQKNPTPPTPSDLGVGSPGAKTEAQYYADEVCTVTATLETISFNNPDVPVLPQTVGAGTYAITTKRASLPNTPTIEIINPNINGGAAQQVINPFYQNVDNQPASPVVLFPESNTGALGRNISGTTTDKTNTIIVFRNDVAIDNITPVASYGVTGTWTYSPTTTGIYKFKAKKNGVESAFSNAITVTNACNLTNNQNISIWNANGQTMRAKTFDGGLTFHYLKIINENPLRFEKRGKNMMLRSDMTPLGRVVLADIYNCFSGIDTGNGGLEYDTTFGTPAGFVKINDYYEQVTLVIPAAPVPDELTGFVGDMITGIANQSGTILVFRDDIQVAKVVTSGVTNIFGYAPLQAGKYTFKNQNDAGTSPFSEKVVITDAPVVTSRKFRAKNINYCDVNPNNLECGTSTTNAAAVTNWQDGNIIQTDLLVNPDLKGYIRDKTNPLKVWGVKVVKS